MTAMVFDIETDGLYWEATVCHVLTIKPLPSLNDTTSPQTISFADYQPLGVTLSGKISDGLNYLSQGTTLIGHNIINFDLPTLKKLYNWTPNESTKIFDTLVVSRLSNPDRVKPAGFTGKGGPHSLEAWGYRIGKAKPEHEDWSVFSPAMLRRNREDVEINTSVYHLLRSELEGHNWSEALELEFEVARIITQQEINGVKFHIEKAHELNNTLRFAVSDIDIELHTHFPGTYKQCGVPISKPFKTDGHLIKRVVDYFKSYNIDPAGLVSGPFTRIVLEPINLNSQTQIKEVLLANGWEPDEWNYDDDGNQTSPKLTESSFHTITGELGNLIKQRTLYNHRLHQVEGWIARVRSDGRISATANTCGTNTGRFRHSSVVNVPKAASHVAFGKEMRSLFCVPEGKVLIGHDAEGLELRMLAHYMDDPQFTEAVVNGDKKLGTDIHTLNQKLAGLPTRDAAKTFIYALIYGAGDAKLGKIVGGDAGAGKELRIRFLKNLPALERLIERVKRASKKGYLKGLDGRKIWMRSSNGKIMQHKALNTLLQSAGAIVMKKSMILLEESVTRNIGNSSVIKVLDMHDEAQAEVLDDTTVIKKYMELAKDSIVKAGEHFKLRVPLAADAAVGSNWAETH